jgi:hypothetical protein
VSRHSPSLTPLLFVLWLITREKPLVDTVTCYTLTPDLAEHAGEVWETTPWRAVQAAAWEMLRSG